MRKSRWLAGIAAAVSLAACAPVQSGPAQPAGDERTGQLRVWLFDEVNRAAKEKVVQEAVAEFQGKHQGVTVDVQYIQVQSRAERFKAAFSDPASAPDVAEFGNTDLAGYVSAGGLADISGEALNWEDVHDVLPAALDATKVDKKVYAIPWYIGVRALYYRTDVFTELGVKPPSTLDEIAPLARRIRAAKPDLLGISVGGKYTYGALPFVWGEGGELATSLNGKFTAAIDSPQAKAGVAKYTELLRDDICPPAQCAGNGGDASVEAFRAGKAAMTIGGDFNRRSVDASAAAGKYAVVPLPGKAPGVIAPAFGGGNLLGLLSGTKHRSLAFEFTQLLAGKQYQRKMFDAMGNLPTFSGLQRELADSVPAIKPFTDTLASGVKFVPNTPAWAKIDAQAVVPTMLQEVARGTKDVDAATKSAADAMNAAFGS
ncbi:extracellular solute-binding protein [Actinokineospora auranticolor]|uniref:N,N'-diacetylchitobiose transport system substrate-binding protein n=1 Tax=Actinokineospora auranticolor TaxID=155976 RepID=A0A2S6H1H6_9PSEU|nr:extracellular solute-binding protein [Actinokineospora auranticolor]PPK71335.1 N,N'-diacetylchitobiose transport system substrate-binding protein [Actinokineospora auranticolor]